jgi:hypothetical protein
MPAQQVQIEMCGRPRICLEADGTVTVTVLLHTTDPTSTVHAEIILCLHPESGQFIFERAWRL